jgi:hypothetical protein
MYFDVVFSEKGQQLGRCPFSSPAKIQTICGGGLPFSRFAGGSKLMFSQKVLGWLSKNFDIQGVVIF